MASVAGKRSQAEDSASQNVTATSPIIAAPAATMAGTVDALTSPRPFNLASTCNHFGNITRPNTMRQHWLHRPPTARIYQSSLKPIVRPSDGKVHPKFPKTYLQYMTLDEATLDELAQFYGQYTFETKQVEAQQAQESEQQPQKQQQRRPTYERQLTMRWALPLYLTTLGNISPYTIAPTITNDVALAAAFNDAMLTSQERLYAKHWMFGWFIGVHEEEMNAVIKMRRARWRQEVFVVLQQFAQVTCNFWFYTV